MGAPSCATVSTPESRATSAAQKTPVWPRGRPPPSTSTRAGSPPWRSRSTCCAGHACCCSTVPSPGRRRTQNPAIPAAAHRGTHHQTRPQTDPANPPNLALGKRTGNRVRARPGHPLTNPTHPNDPGRSQTTTGTVEPDATRATRGDRADPPPQNPHKNDHSAQLTR